MKRLLLTCIALALTATPAQAAHGCHLRGGHVIKQTRAAVLLQRGPLVYGCLRSKGAVYRLTHIQEPRVYTKVFSTRLRGRYVGYGELYYGPTGGDDIVLIRVRDLVTGKVIRSAQNGRSGQAQLIGSMVLKPTGSIAWTTRDYVDWYPPRPVELQVLALDGRRLRVLDTGDGIDLRSLRNGSGLVVSWLKNGTRRSATLRR